jgi:predicted nucleotidyltransferase component of viral defense system
MSYEAPFIETVKKRSQIEVAHLQDEIIDIVYSLTDDIVLHCGTAIWRCDSGKRFSEDLDFYSKSFPRLLPLFQDTIKSHGLSIQNMKDTGNVIFSGIRNNSATVNVEINHVSDIEGNHILCQLADGSSMEILSLTPDEFAEEKILAYNNGRYILDLYDIYHIVISCELKEETVKTLRGFIQELKSPVDEPVLRTIVYQGLAPSLDNMKGTILGRIK